MKTRNRRLTSAALAAVFAFGIVGCLEAKPPPAPGKPADEVMLNDIEKVAEAGAREWNAPVAEAPASLPELDAGGYEAPAVELAHAGQLSPKDNCHRHKAAGERHWHFADTKTRGGPCIKVDGQTWQFMNHTLCRDERVAFAAAKVADGEVDWRAHAEALKECIVGLPAPPPETEPPAARG